MSKVISELLWFCITSLSDWFKVLAPLFQTIRSETKTNCGLRVYVFPCFGRLRVMTSIFDWFTGLSLSFLIGHSNFFGFGFTKLNRNSLYYLIERVSIECYKTKTKVITLANQKGRRQSSKPIKTRSNYM